MELLGMSPTQFAQTVGIQRSTLQHILNGRNDPSLNVVKSIHAALPDVDLVWRMIIPFSETLRILNSRLMSGIITFFRAMSR